MAYINQPPSLQTLFNDLDNRIKKLENATRFTNPNVDFATNTPTNPRIGDQYYDTDAELLKYWNGTEWVEIADKLNATTIDTFYPTLHTTGTAPTYTGNPVTTKVQRIGPMVTTTTVIDGSLVSNWGTGQIYCTMPVGFPPAAYYGVASGAIDKAGTVYTIFSTINAGSTSFYLFHPTSSGGSDTVTYNKPTVLNGSSNIYITGVALLS